MPTAKPIAFAAAESLPRGGGRYQLGDSYQIGGTWYRPEHDPDYDQVGLASWYGSDFHGRLTANGEIFDQNALTGAHPTLPLPSYVRVTNVANQRSVIVRVNDRGPFADNRLIDVSSRAADLLDFKGSGVAEVRVEFVEPARLDGDDAAYLMASYRGPELPALTVATILRPATAPEPRGRPIVVASRKPFDPFQALSSASGSTGGGFGFGKIQGGGPKPSSGFSLRSSYLGARAPRPVFQVLEDFAAR